jgi:hypothetical protein
MHGERVRICNLIFTKYLGQLNQSMRWFGYVACVWTSFSLIYVVLLMPRKQYTWETQALVRK